MGSHGGSSPLTRGKPNHDVGWRDQPRLIPAHAGKTREIFSFARHYGAHPRSRGENPAEGTDRELDAGSSPLTRGKRAERLAVVQHEGLIPAHAGKTGDLVKAYNLDKAHPRSRGENAGGTPGKAPVGGSSPLTRGKRVTGCPQLRADRLIPAHAGKTLPDLRFYCADRSDLGNP